MHHTNLIYSTHGDMPVRREKLSSVCILVGWSILP